MVVCLITNAQNKLEEKENFAKHLEPISDSAIVYIVRPTMFGFLAKMDVHCDIVHVGSMVGKQFVYTVLTPGKHVFTSTSRNVATVEVELEAGKTYYLLQQVKMGMYLDVSKLKILNEADGKKYLKKCKLSNDNFYRNN